jgi:hypothetical protein
MLYWANIELIDLWFDIFWMVLFCFLIRNFVLSNRSKSNRQQPAILYFFVSTFAKCQFYSPFYFDFEFTQSMTMMMIKHLHFVSMIFENGLLLWWNEMIKNLYVCLRVHWRMYRNFLFLLLTTCRKLNSLSKKNLFIFPRSILLQKCVCICMLATYRRDFRELLQNDFCASPHKHTFIHMTIYIINRKALRHRVEWKISKRHQREWKCKEIVCWLLNLMSGNKKKASSSCTEISV